MSDLAPLCDETEFAELVNDEAPRLFALVKELGERGGGRIIAWGLSFAEHAEVIGIQGSMRLQAQCPQQAQQLLSYGHGRLRLVWAGSLPPERGLSAL